LLAGVALLFRGSNPPLTTNRATNAPLQFQGSVTMVRIVLLLLSAETGVIAALLWKFVLA
jgi:hypothetical protein